MDSDTQLARPRSLAVQNDSSLLEKLGPGLITGAADDDPSGIATYTQAGARFGNNLLWTLFLTFPLMVGIQLVSARIGRVSGHGLAGNMRRHYPVWLLYAIVGLLLIANLISIGADIAAMADAIRLLVGGPRSVYVVAIGVICVALQVFISYKKYVRVLKWLTLSLFSYVAVLFAVDISWPDAIRGMLIPTLGGDRDYVTTLVAIFGTTISPYLFFWQASQEREEIRADDASEPLVKHPEQAAVQMRRMRIDTVLGMGFSNLIALFIMLTAAATLQANGITEVHSSAEAAEALRPLAGRFAFLLFSLGIVGTGFLAIPVLAGSAAFALAETLRWRSGLDLRPVHGLRFYGVIAVATLGGTLLGFTPFDPIVALYWAAVANGIVAVPIMAVMMLMAANPRVMGEFVLPPWLKALGWCATAVMAAAVIAMFALSASAR